MYIATCLCQQLSHACVITYLTQQLVCKVCMLPPVAVSSSVQQFMADVDHQQSQQLFVFKPCVYCQEADRHAQ